MRYWSKIDFFFIAPLHLTPPLGWSPWEYCHYVWFGKTSMAWLPDGETNLRICSAVLSEYWHVMDRRMGGQTDRQANRQTDRLTDSWIDR